MEDALKAAHEAEKKALIKDWQQKLKEAVEKARMEEREKANKTIEAQRSTFENQIDV